MFTLDKVVPWGRSFEEYTGMFLPAEADIEARIAATYKQVIDQTRMNQKEFVWEAITSVDELGKVRLATMSAFLADYPAGLMEGRYVNSELPSLPFSDSDFDLALCSHLLFLYSQQLDEEFHHASMPELCRVAKEVRVFPLLVLGGTRSPYLEGSVERLGAAGYNVSIQRVNYEFQRGACEMLRIKRADGLHQDSAHGFNGA